MLWNVLVAAVLAAMPLKPLAELGAIRRKGHN
jgi:hypothetical protein